MRGKAGRPTKFTKLAQARILRAVERGMPFVHAARAAGMTAQTLFTHRSNNQAFADALAVAQAKGIERQLKIVQHATESSDESVRLRAATWWLTHAPGAAEHFSESRRVEFSGLPAGIIVIQWPHQIPSHEKIATANHPAAIAPDAG
jgi:hypothetical protein